MGDGVASALGAIEPLDMMTGLMSALTGLAWTVAGDWTAAGDTVAGSESAFACAIAPGGRVGTEAVAAVPDHWELMAERGGLSPMGVVDAHDERDDGWIELETL